MTTYNAHKRQTSVPPAGFETAVVAFVRQQTHVLERAATGSTVAGVNPTCLKETEKNHKISQDCRLWAEIWTLNFASMKQHFYAFHCEIRLVCIVCILKNLLLLPSNQTQTRHGGRWKNISWTNSVQEMWLWIWSACLYMRPGIPVAITFRRIVGRKNMFLWGSVLRTAVACSHKTCTPDNQVL